MRLAESCQFILIANVSEMCFGNGEACGEHQPGELPAVVAMEKIRAEYSRALGREC